jgi:hypothetical protein
MRHPNSIIGGNMKSNLTMSAVLILFFIAGSLVLGQPKLKADEILEKHRNSIAPAATRSSVKSFIAVGEVRVENITQKSQPTIGRILVASEGTKMFLGMRFNSIDYPEEKVVFDGQKVDVAQIVGRRTLLGNFIRSNGSMVSQGLLFGTLTTAWALTDGNARDYKISSSADSKTIDGRKVYAVNFSPKGSSDLSIALFFDQQTFQHVRTEYKRLISASIGRTVDESARQSEIRESLTEEFSDFKDFKGLTVPGKYEIHYTLTGSTAGTKEMKWKCNFLEYAVNSRFDPGTFVIVN